MPILVTVTVLLIYLLYAFHPLKELGSRRFSRQWLLLEGGLIKSLLIYRVGSLFCLQFPILRGNDTNYNLNTEQLISSDVYFKKNKHEKIK